MRILSSDMFKYNKTMPFFFKKFEKIISFSRLSGKTTETLFSYDYRRRKPLKVLLIKVVKLKRKLIGETKGKIIVFNLILMQP